jgi:hypothetical protein
VARSTCTAAAIRLAGQPSRPSALAVVSLLQDVAHPGFRYWQPWNRQSGTGRFIVTRRQKFLVAAGEYRHDDLGFGSVGEWNMRRELNSLKFVTVSREPHLWRIKWLLDQPSPTGGYIIQKVSGHVVARATDGSGDMVDKPYTFWEAWRVNPGQRGPASGDEFRVGQATLDSSTGTDEVTAVATFYEGLTLPSSFEMLNGDTLAGTTIRSTATDPNLPEDNALTPITRHWSDQW